jgi:hypothetical protein
MPFWMASSGSHDGSPQAVAGGLCTLLHGLDDVLVARAAADVAFRPSRIWASLAPGWRLHKSSALITMPGVQKPHCRPWQALKAACIGCMAVPFCARPSMVVTLRPDLGGQHGAGLDGFAIHMDGAGTALAGVAAHVGAGQGEVVADEFDEQGAGVNGLLHRPPVDGQLELHGHVFLQPRLLKTARDGAGTASRSGSFLRCTAPTVMRVNPPRRHLCRRACFHCAKS